MTSNATRLVGRFSVLSLLALVLVPSLAHAAAYTWTPTAGGTYNWDTAANWGGVAYPNANQDVANMNIDLLGNQVVNLNQAIIVGTLNIGDTAGAPGYNTTTIQAGTAGSLNLQDSGVGGDNIVDISKAAAGSTVTDVISAPIWLNGTGTLNITNAATAGGLTLSGGMHAIGGHYALAKLGAGTVTITGDVNLTPDGSTGALSAPITVNGGGTLDIAAGLTNSFVNLYNQDSSPATIGGASAGNTLSISGTGQFRSGSVVLGGNVAGTGYGSNSAYISSPGTIYNPTVYIGRWGVVYTIGGGANSTNNYMQVSNGAWLDGGSDGGSYENIQLGAAAGATGNQLNVTGAGSTVWWTGGIMSVGNAVGADSNSVTVQSGGRVVLGRYLIVGNSSMDNSVTVTGAGSLMQMGTSGSSAIGNGAAATGNSLTVSSGGWLFNASSLAIGNNNTASGNSLLVTGAGSRMDFAGGLQISSGVTATSNTATIGSGATAYIAGQVSIGGGGGAGQESGLNIGDGTGVSVVTINAANPVTLANANSRLNFNNGLLVANGGGALASGAGQVTLTGTGSISTPLASTISNVIADGSGGAGGLTKLGAGTLTLSGVNTYSGATAANGGILVLDMTSTGVLNSASALAVGGGTFQVLGSAGNVRSQTLNGLTVNAGASVVDTKNVGTSTTIDLRGAGGAQGITRSVAGGTVDFTATSGAFGADAIINTAQANDGTGILGAWATVNGGSALAINNAGVVAAYAGYWGVNDDSSGTIPNDTAKNDRTVASGGGGNIALAAATTDVNTFTHNTANSATVDTFGKTLRVGATGGIFITPGVANLTIGTAADSGTLTAGGNAIADNPGELILNNASSTTLTVNSTIANNGAGAVTVTKSGVGTVVLNGTNTYSGGTYLNSGKLTLGNTKALGATAGTLTINGGTLDSTVTTNVNNNPLTINGDFTYAGTTSSLNLGTGAATLGTASGTTRTITVAANTLTLGGSIADGTIANSLAKSGTGTLVLSGANTYSGATTVNAGVLTAGSTTAFGPATSARLIIPNGATAKVQLNGNNTTVIGLTHGTAINLNAIVENGGAGNATLTVDSNGLYAVVSGLTSTYYGLLQDGGGGGTLSLKKTGNGRLDLYNTANTYSGTTTISDGVLYAAQYGLGTLNALPTPGAADSMGTNHTQAGLVFDGGTLRCTTIVTTNGSAPVTITDRGFTINPGKTASIDVGSGNGNWPPPSSGAMEFTGGCPATTGGLAMVGDYGGLILAGTYAYTGDTIIKNGPKGWGFFQLGDGTTNGTISSGNIVDNGWLIFNTAPATSQTYAGNIRGPGNFTKKGTGTLTLSGTNTYDGMLFPYQSAAYSGASTAVEAGTLVAQKVASLPGQTWAGRIVVASGATLQLSAGGTGEFTGSNLNNVVNNASFKSNTATLAVDTSNATAPVLVSANITMVSATNDHAVTKLGANTLILSGTNTYTGLTTVKAGTLQLGVNAQAPVLTGANGADIQGGKMLLDGSPAVLADLKTGYNASGPWTLGQFDSSTADASHGLGWEIVSGQTKVAYTFYGDATLDGAVDSSDLAKVLANYNQSTGMVWGNGDFNYDDAVDSGDLAKVLANYNQTLPSGISITATSYGQAAAGFNVVPEPSTLVLLAAGLLGLVCYAWRKRK